MITQIKREKSGIFADNEQTTSVPIVTAAPIAIPIEKPLVDQHSDIELEIVDFDPDLELELEIKRQRSEKNRLEALAKMALRKQERENEKRLEEDAKIAQMLAESGHLFAI